MRREILERLKLSAERLKAADDEPFALKQLSLSLSLSPARPAAGNDRRRAGEADMLFFFEKKSAYFVPRKVNLNPQNS